jgi:hypothetical protein
VAQAGLHQYKTLVFKNLVDYYEQYGEGWCASPIADGIKDENGQVILPPGGTTEPQPFGSGAYQVNLQLSDTFVILTSIGTVGNAQTTLQLVATAGGGPAGVWDNAIFAAGEDPNSRAVNGNVAVYGPIHIVRGAEYSTTIKGRTARATPTSRRSWGRSLATVMSISARA